LTAAKRVTLTAVKRVTGRVVVYGVAGGEAAVSANAAASMATASPLSQKEVRRPNAPATAPPASAPSGTAAVDRVRAAGAPGARSGG
jgi:hypothetical protein